MLVKRVATLEYNNDANVDTILGGQRYITRHLDTTFSLNTKEASLTVLFLCDHKLVAYA